MKAALAHDFGVSERRLATGNLAALQDDSSGQPGAFQQRPALVRVRPGVAAE
jgi:hypothetical protein